jgi:hypothetical protein
VSKPNHPTVSPEVPTNIRSLPASSNCEKKMNWPFGEAESPPNGNPEIGETIFTLAVEKLKN